MTQEKALEYLNLSLTKKIDKFSMQLILWLDVGFTLFAVVASLVFETVFLSTLCWVFLAILVIFDIMLFIWCKLCNNPAQGLLFESVGSMATTVKMFLTSILFIKAGERIGWEYIRVFILCLVLTCWMLRKKYKILKALYTNTVSQVREKLQNEKINKIIIPISATSAIAVGILRFTRYSVDIGMGFCFWGLGCFFSFITLVCWWNYFVAHKYQIAKLYRHKDKKF